MILDLLQIFGQTIENPLSKLTVNCVPITQQLKSADLNHKDLSYGKNDRHRTLLVSSNHMDN